MPALKAGRRVVTNLPLKMEEVRKLIPSAEVVEFPLDVIRGEPHRLFEYVKAGDLFVLDEAMKLWPSGEKVNKVPDSYKTLLAEHRHMVDSKGNSLQIVVVVQDLGNLGAFAVRLIDNTFVHTKLSSVGAKGSFRIDVYQGPVKGPQYPISSRLRMMLSQYKPAIWDLYKSHTMSEAPLSGSNEKSLDDRANLWKRPIFLLGVPLIFALTWFGFHMLNKAVAKAQAPIGASRGSATPVPSGAAPVASEGLISASPTPVRLEAKYRVTGWVLNNDNPSMSKAVLSSPGSKFPLMVPYSRCVQVVGEGIRCPVDGVYYSETGGAYADAAGGRPVAEWKMGDPPLAKPAA
jgi:zona occludens toxin